MIPPQHQKYNGKPPQPANLVIFDFDRLNPKLQFFLEQIETWGCFNGYKSDLLGSKTGI
ncbi:MAG: hypothetical protein AAF915_04665 [Cyanobacteria bacterium P01_D01_bin.50]